MPAVNHGKPHKQQARPAQAKPNPNISKALRTRMNQMDPTTLTLAGHLIVLFTSVISGLFGFRFLYKLGVLALIALHGHKMFGAWKGNNRKVSLELAKEDSLPYLVLALFLFWFGRRPLFPLQLAFAAQSGFAVLKMASSNPAALAHPTYKTQTKQLQDALKALEPQAWAVVSHFEILSVPWSLLSAVTGAQSILLPVFCLQFVRFLQVTQPRVARALSVWRDKAVAGLEWAEGQPGVPPTVRAVLANAKASLSATGSKTE